MEYLIQRKSQGHESICNNKGKNGKRRKEMKKKLLVQCLQDLQGYPCVLQQRER